MAKMSGNEIFGMNPEAITVVWKGIVKEFNEMDKIFNVEIGRAFTSIAESWYSPEAVQFGKKNENLLKVKYNLMEMRISERLAKFKQACSKWSQEVGMDFNWFPLDELHMGTLTTLPEFRDNFDGFVGIYNQNLDSRREEFNAILEHLFDSMQRVIYMLRANDILWGACQLENFVNVIIEVRKDMADTFGQIFNDMNAAIKVTQIKYQNTARANAQRFSSGE